MQETTTKHDVREISRHFDVPGDFLSAVNFGTGHINDTYAATRIVDDSKVRFIHQRINHNIFKDPVSMMDNIVRVTAHQRKKLLEGGVPGAERRSLTLVPTMDGKWYYRDGEGNTWRTYLFVEGAKSHDVIKDPVHAYQCARAFGEFQRQLVDLPGERLHDTIPDFHHTPQRFEVLEKAVEKDTVNRAGLAKKEIEFALKQKDMVGVLMDMQKKGQLEERVTHNDTKVNNVMLDEKTNEAICVVDLDTVMPGLTLYDFGDMVRSATNSAAEDEKDLSKVNMQMPVFEALAKGYLETAGDTLHDAEKANLVLSGKLMTFEVGMRFLTDFLSGDVYFKTTREGQNLDRCRNQFKLVRSMMEQEEKMNKAVQSVLAGKR